VNALAARLRPHAPAIAIALAAVAIAWTFAAAVLRTTEFGLPIEDAYIYLTYAKQFGRAQPFTYFPGGGYSAGSTSVLWPMVLAPFWTLGARGHALVWVSFALCSALYAATCVACYRLARDILGELAGIVAAAMTLAIAPFAFCSLSGMEVAFASALLVQAIFLVARAPVDGPPPVKLALCLAAASLSRPEAMMIVAVVVSVRVVQRARARQWRAAAWWASPLAAPICWLVANRLFAGNFFPNTGVAKSHFYLPGFDWTYWWSAVTTQTGRMIHALFWDGASPLPWPKLVAVMWLVGAARILWWARREKRWLVGGLVVAAGPGLVLAVVASSGAWSFHNYRYIAPAFPLIATVAACAIAPWGAHAWLRRAWLAGAGVFVALYAWAAVPGMREDILLYTQNVSDLNTQVVKIGRYLHDKLPEASVMFHDAGAIAYYGDTRVYDMLGLVTNHQADVANNGPGSRFEFLESLPPEQRPTHFAYYPGWMGQAEFFGEVVLATPLPPPFSKRRMIGDADMQLIAATWDHAHTAERPLDEHLGWHIADRVDIADIVSERAHHWHGALGRRNFADPTARWSFVHREVGVQGLLVDGGRTIRGAVEDFTIAVEPDKPVRLVMRSGGNPAYGYNEPITSAATVTVNGVAVTIAPPRGTLAEYVFELPPAHADHLDVHVTASGPYRVFHWFALQPD
jgi:hypothetical protein